MSTRRGFVMGLIFGAGGVLSFAPLLFHAPNLVGAFAVALVATGMVLDRLVPYARF